jgi:hypothetical protein
MPIRKRWAFLVGINRYSDYSSLSYCVDDVLALESLLTTAGYTVVCLHDRLDPEDRDGKPNRRYPTEKNIRAEFRNLCTAIQDGENQGEDDLLLVYFACHGTRQPDDQPRLVAKDTRKSYLVEDAISIAELEQEMVKSGAGCKILMLDACHIGLGKTNTRAPEDPELLRKIHDLAKGYAFIAASTDQQDAYEWDGTKHGVFSYYILSGLSGNADLHGKNYVTVGDLSGYILNELQEWRVRQGVEQVPQGRAEGLGEFILIDNYRQYQPSVVPEIAESVSNSSSQGLQSRGRSPSQIIECLWSLDCETQCQTFKNNTSRSRRAAAFVVQAKDSRIQHWLVKRLVNQIPNVANAKVFPFTIPAHPMWKQRDFGEFWTDLASKLKCSNEPITVIEALVQVYQTKPIIIAMYGWPSIRRSQQLQQQVLDELWHPLIDKIGALDVQPMRSRIILFFAEGHESSGINEEIASMPDAAIPVRLEPLMAITPDHVMDWIESDAVFPVLSEFVPEDQLRALIAEEISAWSPDPATAIEQICYIFELENGIADIEAEWRLAG